MSLNLFALTVFVLFVYINNRKIEQPMSAEPHGLTTIKQVVHGQLPKHVHVYLIWDNMFFQVLHANAIPEQKKVGCKVRTPHQHKPIRVLSVDERAIVVLSAEDLLHANVQATVQAAKGVSNPDYGRACDIAPGFLDRTPMKASDVYDDTIPWVC